jgi:hypothetical protein
VCPHITTKSQAHTLPQCAGSAHAHYEVPVFHTHYSRDPVANSSLQRSGCALVPKPCHTGTELCPHLNTEEGQQLATELMLCQSPAPGETTLQQKELVSLRLQWDKDMDFTTDKPVSVTLPAAPLSFQLPTMTTATGHLLRLEQQRKRITSTVQALSKALATPNLPGQTLAMVQEQWNPIDQLVDNHIQFLDNILVLFGEADQKIVGLQPLTDHMLDSVEGVRQELAAAIIAQVISNCSSSDTAVTYRGKEKTPWHDSSSA